VVFAFVAHAVFFVQIGKPCGCFDVVRAWQVLFRGLKWPWAVARTVKGVGKKEIDVFNDFALWVGIGDEWNWLRAASYFSFQDWHYQLKPRGDSFRDVALPNLSIAWIYPFMAFFFFRCG